MMAIKKIKEKPSSGGLFKMKIVRAWIDFLSMNLIHLSDLLLADHIKEKQQAIGQDQNSFWRGNRFLSLFSSSSSVWSGSYSFSFFMKSQIYGRMIMKKKMKENHHQSKFLSSNNPTFTLYQFLL